MEPSSLTHRRNTGRGVADRNVHVSAHRAADDRACDVLILAIDRDLGAAPAGCRRCAHRCGSAPVHCAAVESQELSDFFSPDEQPDRPAMTIAAPPTATTNPRFTTVLLLFVVTRQDRRIIWVSMGGHPHADMRLGEKFAFAPTVRCLRSTNGPTNEAHSRASAIRSAVWFATMQILRTADEHFTDLAEFPYAPKYCEVSDQDGGTLRMAWVEDGPAHAEPVLMLHGEPSWSFLYRRMMPILAAAGHRVICPDLVGFGRSDKPTQDRRPYVRPSRGVDARAGVRRA